MIKRILLSALAASIVISACHTTKKTTAKVVDTEPAFQLDTVSVVANEVPKKEIYQEETKVVYLWSVCLHIYEIRRPKIGTYKISKIKNGTYIFNLRQNI